MPQWLEDFGRSGSGKALDRMTGVAVELGKSNVQAAATRANFAVDLARLENDTAFRQADLELKRKADVRADAAAADARAASEQSLRRAKLENDELAKKNEWLNKKTRVDLAPAFLSLQPETQKYVLDLFKQNGMLDEQGRAENRAIAEITGQLETSSKLYGQFSSIELKGYESKYLASVKAFEEEKAKGIKAKPEKLEELKAQRDADYQVYQTKAGHAEKGMEVVKMRETFDQRMKEIQARIAGAVKVAKEKGTYTKKLQDELTKAMKGAAAAQSAKLRVQQAGGMDPSTMALLAAQNPEMAKQLQGVDKTQALAALDALIKRYDDQIKALGGTQYLAPTGNEAPAQPEWEDYQ